MGGPLIRSTSGGKAANSLHFPLDPGSTYGKMTGCLELAHQRVCAENEDGINPGLDRGGRAPDAPLQFSNHSNRRGADTCARRDMGEGEGKSGATEEDLNLYFGWKESDYHSDMQFHYQACFIRERRAAVTSML